MESKLLKIITNTLAEINAMRKEKLSLDDVPGLILYGTKGVFDSMQLVSFLAAVEEVLEDELNIEISLTSEKAVSQKISPFSSVKNLIAFIREECEEQELVKISE